MAVKNTQAKRINAKKLEKALSGITALGQISTYSPQRSEFAATKIPDLVKAQRDAAAAEIAAQNALDKARDAATGAEWAVYNFMQGAAEQVLGQYGSSSDEYAAIGYKKKSEYKRPAPGRKKTA